MMVVVMVMVETVVMIVMVMVEMMDMVVMIGCDDNDDGDDGGHGSDNDVTVVIVMVKPWQGEQTWPQALLAPSVIGTHLLTSAPAAPALHPPPLNCGHSHSLSTLGSSKRGPAPGAFHFPFCLEVFHPNLPLATFFLSINEPLKPSPREAPPQGPVSICVLLGCCRLTDRLSLSVACSAITFSRRSVPGEQVLALGVTGSQAPACGGSTRSPR